MITKGTVVDTEGGWEQQPGYRRQEGGHTPSQEVHGGEVSEKGEPG